MKQKTWMFLFLLTVINHNSFAQSESTIELEQIVVTPGGKEELKKNTPTNISVINRAQIEGSKAKTIPELLNTQGSVIIRDYTDNGKSANADIRGFGETGLSNVAVLVDGRKVNNIDTSGTDWTQIPISMVEKIEILRGAGSVLYGDSASGGVINIITKEPSLKEYELKLGGLTGSYETYGEKAEGSFRKGNFSILALFDQYRTDGYRVNSDLIRNDLNGKATFNINDNLKTKLAFGSHKDKYGLPAGLKDIDINTRGRRATTTPDNHANTRDNFFDFGIEGISDELGKIVLNISQRKRDTQANFVASKWLTERDTVTLAFNGKYLLDKKLLNHHNKLIAGIDYADATQTIEDGSYSGNADRLKLSKKNYGFYLTNQFFAAEKFSFLAGARHETAKYNFEQETVLTASEASLFKEDVYNAGLNLAYNEYSNIYASFYESFRLPLVDEVFSSMFDFGFGPGGGLNTALSPQTAKNYEVGIRHGLNRNFMLGLNLYLMQVHNEIYYETTSGNNTNYEHTFHRGLEFSSELKVNSDLKFFGNYTLTEARFREGIYDGKKIPAVPMHKWGMGGEFKFLKYFKFSAFGNYVGERYFISDQPNTLPRMASYFTVDTRLTFDKDNYSLYLGVNNLFNEEYYEYGVANFTRTIKNYYPAPERNFTLGGSIKF